MKSPRPTYGSLLTGVCRLCDNTRNFEGKARTNMILAVVKQAGVGIILFMALGVAWGQNPPSATPEASTGPARPRTDRATSYYHYMLGRRYRELAKIFNRSGLVDRTISEYRQAIEADPDSLFLRTELAEIYATAGRWSDATAECQKVIESDPENVDAHRLLGNLYFHALGSKSGENLPQENIRKAILHLEFVARHKPEETNTLFTLARLYRMNNQTEEAESAFKKILESEPNSRNALGSLARLYSDQGEYEQVVHLLGKVPEEELDNQSLAALAFALHQNGKLEEAGRKYHKVLQRDPGNHRVRRVYVRALLATEDFAEAEKQLKVLLEDNPENGDAYRMLSEIHRRKGKFREALQALEEAKRLQPDSVEVAYSEVILQETLGEEEKAIAVIQEVLARTRKPAGNYTVAEANDRAIFQERLGIAYRTLERFEEAREAFSQMRRLGPAQAPRAEALIIETLRIARKLPQALDTARAAARKYPRDRRLQVLAATLMGIHGQVEEAVAQLKKLQPEGQMDRDITLQIAQVYLQAGQYEVAEQWIAKALESSQDGRDNEYALFMLGSIYERQKRYELAEEKFKQVLAVNPLNAGAANYLGYMLADRGIRLQESVRYIQKALQMEPQNGAFLDSLGWAYFKLNNFDLAEVHLEAAAKRITRDPTIHDHLGHLYYQTGRKQQARDAWERALEAWPGSQSNDFDAQRAQKIRERLKNIEDQAAQQ